MILLCGGEGAAGVKTGGAFFLLVSYAGPDPRRHASGAGARANAVRLMPAEHAGRRHATPRPHDPAHRGLLHSV